MAIANDTASYCLKKSFPEKLADWLFRTSSNWRNVLGFLLIAALTAISISFNVQLGKLSAVDETSATLLPVGYALLDLASLFISGYLGIKAVSYIRKFIAFTWFTFLLALSLWAAATFTISIDSRLDNADIVEAIEKKKTHVASLERQVESWTIKVEETKKYPTAYQAKLDDLTARYNVANAELKALEAENTPSTLAIYERFAIYTPFSSETLNLFVRLAWAAAMTISPLLLGLLLVTNDSTDRNNTASQHGLTWAKPTLKTRLGDFVRRQKVKRFIARSTAYNMKAKQQRLERQKAPTLEPQQNTEKPYIQSFEPVTASLKDGDNVALDKAEIDGIKGHNRHTETLNLNGLRYAQAWLETLKAGQRITRAKITTASKLKSRDSVTRIINELIEAGQLMQRDNGHYYKV